MNFRKSLDRKRHVRSTAGGRFEDMAGPRTAVSDDHKKFIGCFSISSDFFTVTPSLMVFGTSAFSLRHFVAVLSLNC